MNRFLDERPALAAVVFVVGLGVALAGAAYAVSGDREGGVAFVLFLVVGIGSWSFGHGARALLRRRRARRQAAGQW